LEAPAPLFVYGSLCFPDVLRALIDRVPPSEPATARGWRAAALRDRVYPALVPAEDKSADGLLLAELTRDEWRLLDAFEDDVYDLALLQLNDDRAGWAYVATADEDPALPHEWDPTTFEQTALPGYLERCRQWRGRYDASARG
jgi:gamma-glutamylcyclotransferase (GGCT)/AIG2-like uncharacterized protein YtfP